MSKKLIAVASAAALALTGLVGIAPANAAVVATFNLNAASGAADVAFTPDATAAAANAGAGALVVPSGNFLMYTNTADRSSLVKVIVETTVGEAVTVTSTGGMKILDLTDVGTIGNDYKAEVTVGTVDYKADAGVQSLSRTATASNVTFFVFTTTTTAASLTISKSGNTRVAFMKGKAGPAYNIAAALPAVMPTSIPDDNNVIVKITDVFGNTVTANTTIAISATGTGIVTNIGTTPTVGNHALTHSTTEGGHGFKLHKSSSGGFAMSLTLTATDVTGLPKAVKSLFLTTTVADLSGQVTALTAQVAALTAQMADMRTKARSVTKKKYNSLARKYNAQNPSARVALKK